MFISWSFIFLDMVIYWSYRSFNMVLCWSWVLTWSYIGLPWVLTWFYIGLTWVLHNSNRRLISYSWSEGLGSVYVSWERGVREKCCEPTGSEISSPPLCGAICWQWSKTHTHAQAAIKWWARQDQFKKTPLGGRSNSSCNPVVVTPY